MATLHRTADVCATDLDLILTKCEVEFTRLAGGKILITGGAGFLGYYIVKSIVEFNHRNPEELIELWVLDNFMRGCPPWLKKLESENDIHLLQYNIIKPLPAEFARVDYIIHAASIASPIFYRLHPIETMDANVLGVRNLLDQCLNWKQEGHEVSGMLFFSSSEIYGDPAPDAIPTSENYPGIVSCTGPRACYDESKRYGETLCVNFAQAYDIPVKIARPFNNYGPGLKLSDKRVIPDFCRDILDGKDIEILSNGSPTRTFAYVADAVAGYFKVLVNGQAGEAYNIGTVGPEVSVFTLAEKLAKIGRNEFNYQGRVVRAESTDPDYLTDNPQRRCPNLSKSFNELGYEPTITLEEGLARTVRWYVENQNWKEDQ